MRPAHCSPADARFLTRVRPARVQCRADMQGGCAMDTALYQLNSEKMKNLNIRSVFECVLKNSLITRRELSQLTGLTLASITNITSALIAAGYIVETAGAPSGGGRRPLYLSVAPACHYIIGLELRTDRLIGVLTDFTARCLWSEETELDCAEGPAMTLGHIGRFVDRALDATGIARERVLGIGLVSAGPYDYEKERMLSPPNFPGWEDVEITRMVREKTGIPTYFEKDAVGAGLAEAFFGKAAKAGSVFCLLANFVGIGGGFIVNSHAYRGCTGVSCEVGHMIIDLAGERCNCGNYGCLEAMASKKKLLRDAVYALKCGESSMLAARLTDFDELTLDMLLDAVEQGDALARRVADRYCGYVGVGLVNIITLYNPETVVLAGEVFRRSPYIREKLLALANERAYPKSTADTVIEAASFAELQGAFGGAALILRHFADTLEV